MRAVGLALFGAALLLAPTAAGAQNEDAAAEAFARGKELADSRSYLEAIEAFEVAYRLRPHHMVQCSIARCYENLNKPIEAARHYQRCLDEGAGETKLGDQVKRTVVKMQARVARVEVLSPGKGGSVHVDGRKHGEAPATVELNPGAHVIEVRRPGAKSASATLKLLGGERRTVTLAPLDVAVKVEPTPTPAPPVVDRPRRRLSQVWFWTAAGLTAALAVTTTVLGVQTLQLKSDYEGDPTKQKADDFWSRRRLTNVLLGATLAAAAGGTALFFFTDFGGRERPDGAVAAGVGVGGRF